MGYQDHHQKIGQKNMVFSFLMKELKKNYFFVLAVKMLKGKGHYVKNVILNL